MQIKIRFHRTRTALCLLCALAAGLASLRVDRSAFGLFFPAVMGCLGFLEVRVAPKKLPLLWVLGAGLLSGAACFVFTQALAGISTLLTMERSLLLWNILCHGAVFALFYCLTGKTKGAWLLSALFGMFVTLLNYYVVAFRGSPFRVADVFAVKTATAIIGNYTLFYDRLIHRGVLLAAVWLLFCLVSLELPREKARVSRRVLSLVLSGCLLFACYLKGGTMETVEFLNRGMMNRGLAMNLMADGANQVSLGKPQGYDSFDWAGAEEAYLSDEAPEVLPDVIVIMNESFADLRVYSGELGTDRDIMPFFDSLQENTVKGLALSSIFGGSTDNSEYEVLTGNSMAFFPAGFSSFQNYVKEDTWSLVSWMKGLGYEALAMHPENPSNWMRAAAWEKLGFETALFQEDFPRKDLLRGHVSDKEFMEVLLEKLENSASGKPLFLYGVTMQNHGGYSYQDFESTVPLQNGDFPSAEQYLSLIRLSDQRLEELIRYLENREKDTILLFFGDHQPKIENHYYAAINGGDLGPLDQQEKQYMVPFCVWANFDIPEEQMELTSLNRLGLYLLRSAGLPLPPMYRFLQDLEEVIPAMNALGYYSPSAGTFLPIQDAQGEEAKWLQMYRILQYESTRSAEERSALFP